MKYYRNALKLRMNHYERYQAHQQIDTLIQEKLAIKLPYSWDISRFPDAEQHSLVLLRSPVRLNLPCEKEDSLDLKVKDLVSFTCRFCSEIRKYVGDKRVAGIGAENEVVDNFTKSAEKNGLSVLTSVVTDQSIYKIKKPRTPHFSLGEMALSVIAQVEDVSLFERAFVEGLGKKRMFGFGFIHNFEVL